jgi:hypothetical protein
MELAMGRVAEVFCERGWHIGWTHKRKSGWILELTRGRGLVRGSKKKSKAKTEFYLKNSGKSLKASLFNLLF